MAGEEEPDRVELAPEPLRIPPWRGARSQRRGLGLAEQRVLARRFLRRPAAGDREHGLDRGKGGRAVRLQAIERPGRGQALERLLVDGAGIEPRRHLAERSRRRAPPAP